MIKAGKYELLKTSYEDANRIADSYGLPPLSKDNYSFAQRLFSSYGKTQRKDMPRIRTKNQLLLQKRLKQGYIDINKPFAPETNPSDPFPKGISKEQAKNFLVNGLKDNDINDDKINISLKGISATKLKPIQKQIYLSEVFDLYRNQGNKYLKDSLFLCTSDLFILDGHHRFVAALLFNPSLKLKSLLIDLPINKLLPLLLTYTNAIGNAQNEMKLIDILNEI